MSRITNLEGLDLDELSDFTNLASLKSDKKSDLWLLDLDAVKKQASPYQYYPTISNEDFYKKIFHKTEFSYTPISQLRAQDQKRLYQIKPHQLFVKHFLGPSTPYNGLLLFYGTGSGKTCASLLIAEQLRPFVESKGGKIIILGRSKEHVKSIFMKEMYDVDKEISEINNDLPEGSSHCLGSTFFQKSKTKLIDENSFAMAVKKIRKKIQESYEFYGFIEFHKKVKTIEDRHEFLEDYFNNCVFIIDEAHNLSGLDESEKKQSEGANPDLESELESESESGGPDEQIYDERIILEAERIRVKMIRHKRQINLNEIQIRSLVSKLSYQPKEVEAQIIQLKYENEGLSKKFDFHRDQMYDQLEFYFQDQLEKVPGIDSSILVTLAAKLTASCKGVNTMDDYRQRVKGIINSYTGQIDNVTIVLDRLKAPKIVEFLVKIETNSCLRNVFETFVQLITVRGNSAKIGGMKAYQAIKRVLLTIDQSKVILLTATPMRDRPTSIVNLLNILLINDSKPEVRVSDLFPGGDRSPDSEKLAETVKGYVSYYRGNDPDNFPEVIWDLRLHPNVQDVDLLRTLNLEQVQFRLVPNNPRSPVVNLIKCQSDSTDPQEEEYLRYLGFSSQSVSVAQETLRRESSGKEEKFKKEKQKEYNKEIYKLKAKQRIQLEYRCNFVLPILEKDNQYIEEKPKVEFYTEGSDKYLVTYSRATHFDQLFRFFRGKFSYRSDKYGDFMDIDNIGRYSKKIETMLKIVDSVSVREIGHGKKIGGGINLIYSKYAYYGCYLIALALEKMGYRKYKGQSLWETAPARQRCSLCNQLKEDHGDKNLCGGKSGGEFRQAHYIIAVGSSEEVTRYMDVLTSPNNRYGEEIKVVIGTSTITEGLDFKFIRYIHVFEPWYNFTRLDQLAGRGSRQGSHLGYMSVDESLDLEYQYRWENVTVFLYAYFLSKTVIDKKGASSGGDYPTKDLDNYRITLEKDYQIKRIEQILKEASVDCPIYLNLNNHDTDTDYSRMCYYQPCRYKCQYPYPIHLSITRGDDGTLRYYYDGSKDRIEVGRVTADGKTTGDKTLNDLDLDIQYHQTVISYDTHIPIAMDVPLLKQLHLPREIKTDTANRVVAWVVDADRDFSTFYPYIAHALAEQMLPLVKYVVLEHFSLDKPIFSLGQITDLIDGYISFNMPKEYKRALYFYALSLISGTMVPRHLQFKAFSLIPLQMPNDIYYVLHPNYVQDTKTSTYYKHIWPKTIQNMYPYIDLDRWMVEPKKKVDVTTVIREYIDFLSSKPYNQFELYIIFGKKDDSYLLHLLYDLIVNHTFDTSSLQYQYNLVFYLVHFLEYKSLVRVSHCHCDSVFHKKLPPPSDDSSVVFLFQYENSGVLNVRMVHQKSINYENTSLISIPTLIDSRKNESEFAIGTYEFLKSMHQKVFKLKNNRKKNVLEKDKKTGEYKRLAIRDLPRFRNCQTFPFKDESDDNPGLIAIYKGLLSRTQELTETEGSQGIHCDHQPPFYLIGQSKKGELAFFLEDREIKKSGKDMVGLLCSSIELYLHFLHHHDDRFLYFLYNRESSGTPSSKATPARKKPPPKKAKK
jgi:hypothetical protein